jgi:hypothetical protein
MVEESARTDSAAVGRALREASTLGMIVSRSSRDGSAAPARECKRIVRADVRRVHLAPHSLTTRHSNCSVRSRVASLSLRKNVVASVMRAHHLRCSALDAESTGPWVRNLLAALPIAGLRTNKYHCQGRSPSGAHAKNSKDASAVHVRTIDSARGEYGHSENGTMPRKVGPDVDEPNVGRATTPRSV